MPPEPSQDDLETIWGRVRRELESSLPASTIRLWLGAVRPIRAQAETLYLAAPASSRSWIERRYLDPLETALRAAAPELHRVLIVEDRVGQEAAGTGGWTARVESMPLDPAHTFERFVIGSGNRLAHSAALAVAELPGEAYNPLFLHGPPGLGKTHLLGAIADYLRRRRPELTVHYTTAERFTTEFVTALRKDGPERFKHRYRELDALLIDDVQALEGKERTQEEFVHTFNALHAAGKQIVLSSDRPPEALARLAERLRDRFSWGLCVEIGSPDLRTRTALLWRMAAEAPLDLPETSVLGEIASHAADNVRRLEGAMTRVAAFSSVMSEPVTAGLVRQALNRPKPPIAAGGAVDEGPTVVAIQEAVCAVLSVSRADLLSGVRTARVARARQLAIYLSRELTSLSLAQIAREFNRDHSTVLYAHRSVTRKLEPGTELSTLVERTRDLLTADRSGKTHSSPNPT